MDYEEFYHRAFIAALPEAAHSKRSQGPVAVAERAKEQAEAACDVMGLSPPKAAARKPAKRPKTTKL